MIFLPLEPMAISFLNSYYVFIFWYLETKYVSFVVVINKVISNRLNSLEKENIISYLDIYDEQKFKEGADISPHSELKYKTKQKQKQR